MQQTKSCQGCGREIHQTAPMCPSCGARQIGQLTSRNKTVAALLALFLGGFGIQFFYLGRKVAGLICLLFCWTFIPAFVSFVHGILLLCMTEQRFAELYPD